jgi:hypothetical protein
MQGSDVPLPRPPEEAMAFNVNAWGTFDHITLRDNYLSVGDLQLSADGLFDAALPKPLAVSVWLTHLPALGTEQSDVIRGRLRAEAQLVGTVAPLNLDLSGILRGRDLHFRSRPLGDPQAKITGTIDIDEVNIQTERMKLLGGDWEMRAMWPSDPGRSLEIETHVSDLPLSEVTGAFNTQRLDGRAAARASLTIPRAERDALLGSGTFELSNLNSDPFHAGRAAGTMSLRDGTLRIDVSDMRERDGRATALITSDLRTPRTWNVRANLQHWPLEVPRPEASLLVSGSADLRADFAQRAAFGTARADIDLARAGADVGTIALDLAADGRTLHARQIDARVLGGAVEGSATLPIDRPIEARAQLAWRDVEAARLSTWIPRLEGFSGVYSGELHVGPSQDPRALGPLRIDLSLRAPDGGYRAMALTALELSAFVNAAARDPSAAGQAPERWRIVTRDAKAQLAEGRADVFARLSQRSDRTLSAQAHVRFENLSLDQLVHASNPQADPMPGRLAGQLTLAGDPREPRRVFGDANVELLESDLANFDPIGFVYDVMRVGAPRGEGPSGTGRVQARLEAEAIQISSLYYFNRGVEVRGVGAVGEIFTLPDSPISGTLVGTARPLRDLKLPFMADVDEIFSVLQSNATTVAVSGTLREPNVRPTTLDQISDTLRAMLLGDVHRENR